VGSGPHEVCPDDDTTYEVTARDTEIKGEEFGRPSQEASARIAVEVDAAFCEADAGPVKPNEQGVLCTTDILGHSEEPIGLSAGGIGVGIERTSLVTDTEGNLYVVSHFNGTIDFGEGPIESAGVLDSFVAKYDSECRLLWSARYGGPNAETQLTGAAWRANGELVLSGSFVGDITLGSESYTASRTEGLLVTIDAADGSVLSARTIGSQVDAVVISQVGIDSAGDVYIAGFGALDAFLSDRPLGMAANQPFVAKLSAATGAVMWGYAVLNADVFLRLYVRPGGEAAVSGWGRGGTSVEFDASAFPIGGEQLRRFVALLTSEGDMLWGVELSVDLDADAYGYPGGAIVLDADGSMIFEHGNFGAFEVMDGLEVPERITKINRYAETEWSIQPAEGLSQTRFDTMNGLAIDSLGNFFYTEEIEEVEGNVRFDLGIDKRGPGGDLVWRHLITQDMHDWNWGLVVGHDGTLWVGHADFAPHGFDVALHITKLAPDPRSAP
jgi:hypothetical protein